MPSSWPRSCPAPLEVVDLARLASVAAIVEPALLRRLRQRAAAGAGRRSGGGPVVQPADPRGVGDGLDHAHRRRHPVARPAGTQTYWSSAANAARAIVVEAHAGHSDMLRLEDTIIWES